MLQKSKLMKIDFEEYVILYLHIKFDVTYGQAIWHFNMCSSDFWDMMADMEPAHFIAEVIAKRRRLKIRKN